MHYTACIMHFFLLVVYAFKDNWIENLWKKFRLLSIAWVVLSALIQPKIFSNFHALQTQKWSDQFGRKLNVKTHKKKNKKKTSLREGRCWTLQAPKTFNIKFLPASLMQNQPKRSRELKKGPLVIFISIFKRTFPCYVCKKR